MMRYSEFLNDIYFLRDKVRNNVQQKFISESLQPDTTELIDLLNIALATECLCTLRYKQHYYKAKDLRNMQAAQIFLEHSKQEWEHTERLAERIYQLGGIPHMGPQYIQSHSHAQYIECDRIDDMVQENLIAERIAVNTYRELIKHIGNSDSITKNLLESILTVEEEHANELIELDSDYDSYGGLAFA